MKIIINLRTLICICVFALMMGVFLIPQTANAAEETTIYWAVDSNQNLVISDHEVTGAEQGSFPSSTRLEVDFAVDFENTAPWGAGIKTVKIEGKPAPQNTDYWF